jgi:hypothetical protein
MQKQSPISQRRWGFLISGAPRLVISGEKGEDWFVMVKGLEGQRAEFNSGGEISYAIKTTTPPFQRGCRIP